jgi:hypothetical protein
MQKKNKRLTRNKKILELIARKIKFYVYLTQIYASRSGIAKKNYSHIAKQRVGSASLQNIRNAEFLNFHDWHHFITTNLKSQTFRPWVLDFFFAKKIIKMFS